jgi:hypothetical protein
MNEAFTIGNNNSIYTFDSKIIVYRQAQSPNLVLRYPTAGEVCLHPDVYIRANVTGKTWQPGQHLSHFLLFLTKF